MGCDFYFTVFQRLANFGGAHGHVVHLAGFYFNHLVAKAFAMPTQVMNVTLSTQTETVIVPDDDTFRVKFFHQKLLDVLVSTHLGKFYRKRYNHQMVNMVTFKKLDFFFGGRNQAQRCILGKNNRTGMRMKSDDYTFASVTQGNLPYLFNNALMPLMDAVERTNGNNGIFEIWQIVEVAVNYHGPAKVIRACLKAEVGKSI